MRRGGGLGLRRGSRGCGNSEPVYEAAASHHLKISPITAARRPLHSALVSKIQFRNKQIHKYKIHKYENMQTPAIMWKYPLLGLHTFSCTEKSKHSTNRNREVQKYKRQLSSGNVPHYERSPTNQVRGWADHHLVSSIHPIVSFLFSGLQEHE